MNLVDLLDESGLQQDAYSKMGAVFGDNGQLSLIGWSGKRGTNKHYILKCDECSADTELFGEGIFRSLKGDLVKGKHPCGCGKTKWTKEQYTIICSRKAKELGYTFLGFGPDWGGRKTKIRMLCEKHGEWRSGLIASLIDMACGCPGCGADTVRVARTKSDEEMVLSFFASGVFHPDTKFWRSERETKSGVRKYWYIHCGYCNGQGESISSDLQSGHMSCVCSPHRQRECYINLVCDGDSTVALKFGIAINSASRVDSQNRYSIFNVVNRSVYKFPDTTSCKAAERECKKELDCGVILKRDMPDGYTETTHVYNLDKIIQIYKNHGGVKL